MKYCTHCGAQIEDEAIYCIHCGCGTGREIKPAAQTDDTMQTVIKVFLILGCVALGWLIIPLAWCIPITVNICNKMKNHEKISDGQKICALLLVNLVAGICLLCDENL